MRFTGSAFRLVLCGDCLRFTDVQARPIEFLDLTSLTLDEFQQGPVPVDNG